MRHSWAKQTSAAMAPSEHTPPSYLKNTVFAEMFMDKFFIVHFRYIIHKHPFLFLTEEGIIPVYCWGVSDWSLIAKVKIAQCMTVSLCYSVRCVALWVDTSASYVSDSFMLSFWFFRVQNREDIRLECKTKNQLCKQISQQAMSTSTLPPKLHLYPVSSTCITLIGLLYISKSLFIGIYQGFYHFSYKRMGSISPPFCNVAHLWHRIGVISDPSTILSDSHISMSLLGLSLPSQWSWSSEDHALERQRAPAAPTFPHPSFYPSLSAQPSFSLHYMLGLTWRHPDILSRFWLGRQPRL